METALIVATITSTTSVLVALLNFFLTQRQKKRIDVNESNLQDTKITLQDNNVKLKDNEEKLTRNEEKLNNLLLVYRPGSVPYQLLLYIKYKGKVPNFDSINITYNDDADPDQKRCLNHLLDDGYLQPVHDGEYIRFFPDNKGRRLEDMVKTTPLADILIDYRKKVELNNAL